MKLTPEERADLDELRNDYDVLKPDEVKMIPIPHHRLRRLVELERRDAAAETSLGSVANARSPR